MKISSTYFLILFLCVFSCKIVSQNDSIWNSDPKINISCFVDAFYAFDFNNPSTSYRQTFLYNHNRHNEINLNLGYFKVSTEHEKYRLNFALHAGTYVNDNYASEPNLLKNIFEANAGISLNKKNNLWLDVGIFNSHIGFESATSIDNKTLTRSLLAENSPYYLSGAKITYSTTNKLELAVLICNGWQHIQKVSGNSLPSFGTQLLFEPSKKTTLNWSTFIGTDDPDSTRRIRYFNNLYGQFQLTKKMHLTLGFDIGIQQNQKHSTQYNHWLSPVLIFQIEANKKWALATRAEYYDDKNGIIIHTGLNNEFKTYGASLNIDYTPVKAVKCRVEGRYFFNNDSIFIQNNKTTNNNWFIVASIAIKLEKQL